MSHDRSVAVIVLNWNGWEDTKECLSSLQRSTYPAVQVYAVDNGSTDGSPEKIAATYPTVTLIQLPENRGFGGGMNAGIEVALQDGHDFVLCMNNDMVAEPDFLEPLVLAAEVEKVVPYPALFQRDRPDTVDALGNRINLMTGMTSAMASGTQEVRPRIAPDYTEIPLLSRELLQTVGTWREEYFAFYEDADLGLRIHDAGWRLVLVPDSRILHKRGATADRVPGIRSYYSMRNRLLVIRSHGSWWHYATTVLHILVFTLPYLTLRRALRANYKHSMHHVLAGIADGLLPGRRGPARKRQTATLTPSSKP